MIIEIKNAYNEIEDEAISNMIDSFPNRLAECIENEGWESSILVYNFLYYTEEKFCLIFFTFSLNFFDF